MNVLEEIKKLSFPSKKDVYVTTFVIAISIVVTTFFVLVADFIISKLIGFLL